MKYFLYVEPDGEVVFANTITELLRGEGQREKPITQEEVEQITDLPGLQAGGTLLLMDEGFVGYLGEVDYFSCMTLVVSRVIDRVPAHQYAAPVRPGGLYEARSDGITILGHDMERSKDGFTVTDRTGLTTTVTA